MNKQEFKFYLPNGDVGTIEDVPALLEGDRIVREEQLEAFYNSIESEEREWRNNELLATDWCFSPDATIEKELLAGSSRLEQILEYRQQVKAYNMRDEPRPVRPDWLK
ncbi:hypothetical protein [Photobacterium sp. OFAV2-7]|uniref:hypothetical protein n=1 Tax=Photobacterium sp. OFAV2-7 TaxID=2917748 RepID=UPI001EF4560F|nr:hypothetical protein [Photobacterium sp. OFAV2-7]MCG7587081.1 hypothetical protein [Photobacterium sp. OFAV2-7]